MSEIWHILRSGHWPSLVGAWLHLTVSFMVWLLVGAMSIPLAKALQLSDQEIAWLVSLPLLGGALLRMVAGWSADWLGARSTAIVILVAECLVLCWGWLGVTGYGEALVFSVCLGVAGASFSVALPIASRAYPLPAQGFVLGLAASGNIGTVLILFLAPRWAAARIGIRSAASWPGWLRRPWWYLWQWCRRTRRFLGLQCRGVVAPMRRS